MLSVILCTCGAFMCLLVLLIRRYLFIDRCKHEWEVIESTYAPPIIDLSRNEFNGTVSTFNRLIANGDMQGHTSFILRCNKCNKLETTILEGKKHASTNAISR